MATTRGVSAGLSTSSDPITTDGPIVLAAKPFEMPDAPLAVARWLARREDRELADAFAAIAIFRRLGAVREVEALERRFASME